MSFILSEFTAQAAMLTSQCAHEEKHILVGSWAAPVDRSIPRTLPPVEASEEAVDPAAGPVGPGGNRCLV